MEYIKIYRHFLFRNIYIKIAQFQKRGESMWNTLAPSFLPRLLNHSDPVGMLVDLGALEQKRDLQYWGSNRVNSIGPRTSKKGKLFRCSASVPLFGKRGPESTFPTSL